LTSPTNDNGPPEFLGRAFFFFVILRPRIEEANPVLLSSLGTNGAKELQVTPRPKNLLFRSDWKNSKADSSLGKIYILWPTTLC
jgi:hypothetical protein